MLNPLRSDPQPAEPDTAAKPPHTTGVEVLAHGHLTAPALQRTDRNGKVYTIARMAVPDRATFTTLRLISHAPAVGETLVRMQPGDPLTVAGQLVLHDDTDNGSPLGLNARRILSTIRNYDRSAA